MYTAVIAGGIASGKSTFARELERLGALRIDLDQVSREVLVNDRALIEAIAAEFGRDILDESGAIVRRALAARAFSSPDAAARLEALELPAIERALKERLVAAAALPKPPELVVVEIPLLDRANLGELDVDEVVCVIVPMEERVRRAVARGMDEADARARMANQPSDAWLRERADTCIENDGTEGELREAARAWLSERASSPRCAGRQ